MGHSAICMMTGRGTKAITRMVRSMDWGSISVKMAGPTWESTKMANAMG